MMLMNGKILFIILVFLFSGYSFSQEVKDLTLEESISLGLENSHTLHASRQNVLNSEARLREVNSAYLPQLSFNAAYTRLSPIDPFVFSLPAGLPFTFPDFELQQNIENAYTFRLSLQQPIFTGFKISSSSDMAKYSSLASQETYTKDEHELLLNIKTAYWNVFKAKKFKEVVDENVGQIRAHLNDVQNLFKQGMSTKNDVLKVQVQLAEAELRQIDALNNVRLSIVNLNNLIGLPLDTEINIKTQINPAVDKTPDINELIERAYESRPELKSMDYLIQARESGVKLAQSNWYPQIYLGGNYNYANPNQRVFPQEEKFKGTWDVSLSLQFDIWNWGRTSSQTDQAETQLQQTKDNYQSLRDGVRLEVTQTYLNILQAKEKIQVAENSVGQAEENYRVTNEKFKNGLVLNSELIDAEVALLTAKTNHIQSLVDYEIAQARLQRSIGE